MNPDHELMQHDPNKTLEIALRNIANGAWNTGRVPPLWNANKYAEEALRSAGLWEQPSD